MNETETRGINLRSCPCPICNTDRFMDWHRGGLEFCGSCGHVRKSSPGEEENGEWIQKTYFDGEFALQDDFFTRLYEGMNARRRLRELIGFIKRGRALEVGVGRGNLLATMQASGYKVEGIDLSDAVCAAVQTRYGIPVHCGTLETFAETMPAGTFDMIMMCHVLEHIKSLGPALRAVRHLLKQQGILYVAVPNLSAWDAHLPGWTGYEPYHLHYFQAVNLRRILESTGFRVQREKTFEPVSGWFNALARTARSRTPDISSRFDSQPREDALRRGSIWALYNLMRLATGTILSPLRWFQSATGYGEELVMIARAEGSTPVAHD